VNTVPRLREEIRSASFISTGDLFDPRRFRSVASRRARVGNDTNCRGRGGDHALPARPGRVGAVPRSRQTPQTGTVFVRVDQAGYPDRSTKMAFLMSTGNLADPLP